MHCNTELTVIAFELFNIIIVIELNYIVSYRIILHYNSRYLGIVLGIFLGIFLSIGRSEGRGVGRGVGPAGCGTGTAAARVDRALVGGGGSEGGPCTGRRRRQRGWTVH